MKIVFLGTPDFVTPVLNKLKDNFEVTEEIREPRTFDSREISRLKVLNPDLFVVAAYGQILAQELLQIPKLGAINIHPSLLPLYRGPTPIQTAILNGDSLTGVSFIKMDEKVDHGPIILQFPSEIFSKDTFESLAQRLFKEAADEIVDVILLSDKNLEKKQDDTAATFTKMLTKQNGFIDPNNPPAVDLLNRMIRAYYPWPSVWTRFDLGNKEQVVKLLPEQMVQVEGKRPMSFKDFINGYEKGKELLRSLNLS